jgi:hypothetical protein
VIERSTISLEAVEKVSSSIGRLGFVDCLVLP